MAYKVKFERRAEKELSKMDKHIQKGLMKIIEEKLAVNPRGSGCRQLVNSESWRYRQGDYRVIYDIEDEILMVYVLKVAHRKEAYKKK